MEYKKFNDKYILRLEKDEEIVESLKEFAQKENIKVGKVSGIGAVDKATVGLFSTSTKKYQSTDLKGDMEIVSLSGNISTMEDKVYIHLHIALGDDKFNIRGGHLNSAVISGTGEIIVESIEGKVDRKFDEEVGLNLFKFD